MIDSTSTRLPPPLAGRTPPQSPPADSPISANGRRLAAEKGPGALELSPGKGPGPRKLSPGKRGTRPGVRGEENRDGSVTGGAADPSRGSRIRDPTMLMGRKLKP
jgi:hypothetical protein